MNDLTEKILGALGLGIAGLIATFFVVFNARFKEWLKKVLWPPKPRPEEPETPKPEPPKAAQSISLVGHWSGDGWRYTLKGHLRRSHGVFEGQLEWTFQDFPPDYEHPKWARNRLRRSGTEFVSRVLTGNRLTLTGNGVSDPHGLGILLCDYTIEIDEEGQTFQGTSVEHQTKKTGTLTGGVSIQQ